MATVKGSSKNDRLQGTSFDDVVYGYEGDDELKGYGGRDELNGGDGDDDLFGGAHADVLNGGEGFDRLDGGTGADTMAGGIGYDTYYVDNIGDVVIEAKNEGNDSVHSTISYTLPSHVEQLYLEEVATAINGTGNGSHNVIYGNSRDNTLSGEGGHDWLKGGGGNDLLIGGSGDDHMDPGSLDMSADGMVGGFGNDTYMVFEADDAVVENPNEGVDEVETFIDYVLGADVENLTLRDRVREGTGNDLDNVIMGNGADNWLHGEGGNDTLYTRGGADRLFGGMGDDTFYLTGGSTGVDVFEWANEGTDRIVAHTSYTLPENVEILSFGRTFDNHPELAINGTGNVLDNTIYGSAGINVLMGRDGDDRLYGYGEIDVLSGEAGNDTLDGGAGLDVLTGGSGVDTFQFNLPSEGADTVTDFLSGTDRVALDDAGFGLPGTGTLAANGVAFVQGAAATSAGATVLFDAATHQLLWDADGTGAGSAQLLATLVSVNAMSASDFMIV